MRQYIQLLRHHKWAIPVIVTLVIGVEAIQLVPYMTSHDVYPDYYYSVTYFVMGCDPFDFPEKRNALSWWLFCVGYHVTDGYPTFFMIPFNIAVLPMTYLVATALTKNDRIIGLISVVTMANIPLYTDWSASGTYNMVWAFFVLLSLWLLFKQKNTTTIFAIILSILAKAMTILFIPAWIYSAIKRRMYFTAIASCFVLGIGLLFILDNPSAWVGNSIGFYATDADAILDAVIRNISLLWQVIPFTLGLFAVYAGFKAKNNPYGISDVMVWIVLMVFMAPVIHLFTEQDTYSYRYVVLGAFISIFTGQVLTRVGNYITEVQMRPKKQIKSFIKD